MRRSSRRRAEAAEESARTAAVLVARGRDSVEELLRSRIDATAPRVTLTDLHLDWPPYVAAPPSDGVFSSPGLWRRLTADQRIVLPRDETLDLYLICRGTVRNDGAGAGRVSFTERVLLAGDGGSGTGTGELIDSFVLEPGRSMAVVFPIRRKIPGLGHRPSRLTPVRPLQHVRRAGRRPHRLHDGVRGRHPTAAGAG